MVNQYDKKCCWCKVVVPAGYGKVWNYNGRWYVGCQDCLDDKFKDDKGDQLPYFFAFIKQAWSKPCLQNFDKFYF